MKYPALLLSLLCFFLLSSCKTNETNRKNGSSEKQSTSDNHWVSIFNGKDLTGWTAKVNGFQLGDNFNNTFRVEDGILKISYDEYGDKFTQPTGRAFGHLFYKDILSDYKLRCQYRFVGEQVEEIGTWAIKNSGIMLHSQSPESMTKNQEFPMSLEAQLLGGYQEGVERPTGNICTPGMHITMKDTFTTQHCINSSSDTYYGEEWIDFEVEVYHDSLIIQKVFGKEVSRCTKPVWGGEYTPDTPEWKAKEGQAVKSGYISLQSESHPIEFKNIELMKLTN